MSGAQESSPRTAPRAAARVEVRGVVQGVGFRPYVHALATGLGLAGAVWNDTGGVVVEVEGDPTAVAAFGDRVAADAPPLALVTGVVVRELRPSGRTGFVIRPSERSPGRTLVPPDVAICDACLADLTDPGNRRYRHPFVTCTNCGPRFTITTALPYDRPATTMAAFAMCPACAAEYADPADRRFHAQTVCCPDCGPVVRVERPGHRTAYGEEALAEARRMLAAGAVVAVKGIGGYHLACDAADDAAVALLRKRKQRGDKALAVMVATVDEAEQLVVLDADGRRALTERARPILLAPRRRDAALSAAVAPGSGDLGVMLAYTPLHHLLLGLPGDPAGPRTLVMTSGNLSGEPIVTDDEQARTRLAGLADAWLVHDRQIHVPCDDSVTRVVAGRESPVRRSRGRAPLPLGLPFDTTAAFAAGADLKSVFCLAEGGTAWLSGHLGDLDDLATQQAYDAAVTQLSRLTGVQPRALAADLHPGYRSRRWALDHARGRPVVGVQHHHAHVAATMTEHGVGPGAEVLGLAFDGTGYGDDAAVWGGELLLASYVGYRRLGHLRYVSLPGGDAGVRNPCRMALSHLRAAGRSWDSRLPAVAACSAEELRLLDRQLATGLRCTPTSSMGRLFDAVASLTGICHRTGYDAQPALELEALAREAGVQGSRDVHRYRFALHHDQWDAAPVVAAVADDVLAGVPAAVVAARFQAAVVALTRAVARDARDRTGRSTVTLSGGVFLNAYLTEHCERALAGDGFTVLRHERVPCSDAGVALGQVAVLAHRPAQDPGMRDRGVGNPRARRPYEQDRSQPRQTEESTCA